jgi:hypothetical protein
VLTKRELLHSGALTAITIATTKSFPASAQTSADRPGFFKAKDVAEAGFIYGLPIVMNYGVMYEYAVDRNSGQFKATFNQIKNEPQSSPTKIQPFPRRTATRPIHSYGWTCGRSRSSFRSRRWTRSATTRSCSATAILTTTAISVAVPRAASRAITWWSGRTGRVRHPRGSKKFSSRVPSFRWRAIARSFSIRTTSITSRRSKLATRYKRCPPT